MNATASQVIQEARRLIDRGGWVQGTAEHVEANGSRSYCILGAYWAAKNRLRLPEDYRSGALDALYAALAEIDPAWSGLDKFNDTPGRTKADVLALFDRALTKVTK